MLKEYDIAPSSKSITVQEGSNPPVALKATRTAYSVFGTVFPFVCVRVCACVYLCMCVCM